MHIPWFVISYCNQICSHTRWQVFEMLYLARDGVEPNIMLQGLHKTLTFRFWHIESINNGNMQPETRKEKVYYAHSISCQPHQTLVIVQFLNVARWTRGKISISAWTLHKCPWDVHKIHISNKCSGEVGLLNNKGHVMWHRLFLLGLGFIAITHWCSGHCGQALDQGGGHMC